MVDPWEEHGDSKWRIISNGCFHHSKTPSIRSEISIRLGRGPASGLGRGLGPQATAQPRGWAAAWAAGHALPGVVPRPAAQAAAPPQARGPTFCAQPSGVCLPFTNRCSTSIKNPQESAWSETVKND